MKQELNTVRPSSAHRWMKCAYSAFAEGMLPRSSSPAAEIGTRTHAVAAQRLYNALKEAFPDADITAPPRPRDRRSQQRYLRRLRRLLRQVRY